MNASSGLVFVEGNSTLSFTNNVNNIKDSIIRLGSNKDNTLSLNGYIEKLGVSKEYFTSSQIQTIINDNLDVVLRHEYDGIGRITSKHLFVNDMEFNKSYTYKSIDGLLKTSNLIKEETLIDGKTQLYEYDDYGNVTKKTLESSAGLVEEEYIYTYDKLFRLKR